MSNKPDPSMTPEEITDFLAHRSIAVICAPGPDGRLIARMARYSADGQNLILSDTGPAHDLPTCPGAIALIDTYPSYDEIQGVMLRGTLARNDTTHLQTTRLLTKRASGFDFRKVPKLG